MALRFPFRRVRVPHTVPSLGGKFIRPRPLVTVTVLGPGGGWPIETLLDTGADDSAFPSALAGLIGLDLTNAPTRALTGIGPTGYHVQYAQVTLRLTDGAEYREWPAWVGFTNAPLPTPVLGFAGCLQFFTTTFHGDFEEVTLAVNPLYPGT
jgi:hypothetical protein